MKKMKKRVAVSCYEFQIVGLERSKRGLRGRPTAHYATNRTFECMYAHLSRIACDCCMDECRLS